MLYDLRIGKKDDILWATVTGRRSLETILSVSKDILAACAEKKVDKVLVDVRGMEGRLGTTEAYRIPSEYFPTMPHRGVITRAALVDNDSEHDDRFFENVARNRGFPLRIFSGPEEAVQWLKE